jgi:hypothetical protein
MFPRSRAIEGVYARTEEQVTIKRLSEPVRSRTWCPGCDPRWPINVNRMARYNRSLRMWVTCADTRADAVRLLDAEWNRRDEAKNVQTVGKPRRQEPMKRVVIPELAGPAPVPQAVPSSDPFFARKQRTTAGDIPASEPPATPAIPPRS